MTTKSVLIIDDEPDIRELLQITLQRMGVDSLLAENLSQARELLNKHSFDLCLTDMKLPDGNGLDFIIEIQEQKPFIPIAVITAHGSVDSAIEALKRGAFDFLTKPIELKTFRTIVKNALDLKLSKQAPKSTLIGKSKAIDSLLLMIKKISRSQAPTTIVGESGTGKELVAHMIHELGPRVKKPFIPINCGAIPDELMESEFFGHKKGSFTGAVSDKEGLFRAADGGTLFLDEISELPSHMQVKLLRAIQEKKIRPVGDEREITVNVRILSATNRNLATMITEGLFRQDLYYRINVIELKTPPLRERTSDISLLADFFLDKLSIQNEVKKINISNAAIDLLKSYDYPGNVRELENILERAVAMCSNNSIDIKDIVFPQNNPSNQPLEIKNNIYSAAEENLNTKDESLNSMLDNIEKQKIIEVLQKTSGNKTAAARLLGISFRALRYRLDKLKLKNPK